MNGFKRSPWAWLLMVVGGWAFVAGLAGCGSPSPQTLSAPSELPYHTPAAEVTTPTLAPTLSPESMATPRPPQVLGAFYERRLLTVEWPRRLRQGDSDWVRLRLEVDERGTITPTVTVGEHEIEGQPVYIPDLYDTHHVYVQARLDAVGLHLKPAGMVQEPLQPGQTVELYWTLRGDEAGTYQAVLTARLRLVPRAETSTEREIVLAHQLFQVQVVNFLGLSGFWVRMGGIFSAVLGMLLQVPDLLDLWERLRRRNAQQPSSQA